jgi:hypothetical protein
MPSEATIKESLEGRCCYLLAVLQVEDISFTFSTVNCCEAPAEVPALAPAPVLIPAWALAPGLALEADEPEAEPVSSTSSPTCLLSFELSPES